MPKDLCTSAHICPQQIFVHILIFATKKIASPMIFAHRSSHVFWYVPKDLRTFADFCPQQIFAHSLIFAKVLLTSADIWPQIFARLLIIAKRSSHVCWYLPSVYLRASSDNCQKIFALLLIFAHISLQVCWYWPTDLCTSSNIW